mgnify:CR=1 FL=1
MFYQDIQYVSFNQDDINLFLERTIKRTMLEFGRIIAQLVNWSSKVTAADSAVAFKWKRFESSETQALFTTVLQATLCEQWGLESF